MKLKLCLDSGGTKTIGLLFDEQFRLLGTGTGGAANVRFVPRDAALQSIRQCLSGCLRDYPGSQLEQLYATSFIQLDELVGIASQVCPIGRVHLLSEGEASLLAGTQQRFGIVALSGTGSAVFSMNAAGSRVAGGWGSWIGDEGSGSAIGRQGIAAAIYDAEGRGAATLLTPLIMERFNLSRLRDLIGVLHADASPRTMIASVAKLVSEAAGSGDPCALRIIGAAGEEMARQTIAFIRGNAGEDGRMITVAGGAWKGQRGMFDSFCKAVRNVYPDADIRWPLFEPVMGGVIAEAIRQSGGVRLDPSSASRLANRFACFRCAPPS